MTDIPPHRGDEHPGSYAQRLIGMWATDDTEAHSAWNAMLAREARSEDRDVADDVTYALSRVRQANGDAHRPMIDCGHCWAGRNGQADRNGDWQVVICEECDLPWPCPNINTPKP